MSDDQPDPAEFDGVTPDQRRAAEKREAAARAAGLGGDPIEDAPAEPKSKSRRGQTTR